MPEMQYDVQYEQLSFPSSTTIPLFNTNEENGKYFFHDLKAHYQKVTALAYFKKEETHRK